MNDGGPAFPSENLTSIGAYVEEAAKNLVKAVTDMFDLGAYAVNADDGLCQDQRRIEVQLPPRVLTSCFMSK